MKKKCVKCEKEKTTKEFYKQSDRKNGSSFCKECFNSYCIQRWIQKKINAITYKGLKCVDCPISYPTYPYVVFDFHHLEPSQKSFDWGRLRLRSEDAIKKELDKCVMLCATCHRVREHLMRQS